MKTFKKISLILFIFFVGFAFSQSNIIVKKHFPISDFSKLEISGSIDYILVDQKEQPHIIVEAPKELIQYVSIKQNANVLNIGLQNFTSLNSYDTFNIYIPVSRKMLKSIRHSGSGEMTSKVTLSYNSLKITHSGSGETSTLVNCFELIVTGSGSGEIEIKGNTNLANLTLSGSGEILAKKLKSKNANITLSGSGEVEISVSQKLKATISGSGEIYYNGTPSNISSNINGSGNLIQL